MTNPGCWSLEKRHILKLEVKTKIHTPGEVVFFPTDFSFFPSFKFLHNNLYYTSFCRKLPKTLGVVERNGSTLKISVQK